MVAERVYHFAGIAQPVIVDGDDGNKRFHGLFLFFLQPEHSPVSEAYIFSEPQAPEAAGGFYFFKQRHPVSRPDYIVQGVGQVFADDRFPFGMFLPECLHLGTYGGVSLDVAHSEAIGHNGVGTYSSPEESLGNVAYSLCIQINHHGKRMVFVDNAGMKASEAFFQEQAIDHAQVNGSEEQAVAQLIIL